VGYLIFGGFLIDIGRDIRGIEEVVGDGSSWEQRSRSEAKR